MLAWELHGLLWPAANLEHIHAITLFFQVKQKSHCDGTVLLWSFRNTVHTKKAMIDIYIFLNMYYHLQKFANIFLCESSRQVGSTSRRPLGDAVAGGCRLTLNRPITDKNAECCQPKSYSRGKRCSRTCAGDIHHPFFCFNGCTVHPQSVLTSNSIFRTMPILLRDMEVIQKFLKITGLVLMIEAISLSKFRRNSRDISCLPRPYADVCMLEKDS